MSEDTTQMLKQFANGNHVIPAEDFPRMEKLRDELEEYFPLFAEALEAIDELEKFRAQEETAITSWMRGLFPLVGLPEPEIPSLPIKLITAIDQKALDFVQQSQKADKAMRKINAKHDETRQGRMDAICKVYGDAGYENFGDAITKWEDFKEEVLAVRERVLALPEVNSNAELSAWGSGLEDIQKLPDGYRAIDTAGAKEAVADLFKSLAKYFTDIVTSVDAAQPPFEKIDAVCVNVSGVFPSSLVVGRMESFASEHRDALKELGVPETMPRHIDFPFVAPLIYEDAGLLQMLVLRMAQALPQGLFEACAIDSENVGKTFREIAGLRKSGILSVSSRRDDNERILSQLDTWLGDISDSGRMDDSSDWADYNRQHLESPLPFKFVLFPTFTELDATQLSTVAKLAKNGPSFGIVPAFSKTALDSLAARETEPIANDLLEKAKQFVSLDSLME